MKILMLGNGFDLYHKLPTTYLSFLQTAHFISEMEKTPDNIAEVFSELRKDCKEINTSYSAYEEFYKNYHFDEPDKRQLIELKAIVKENDWFFFLWNIYNKDVGWIDFEREISKVLSMFSRALSSRLHYNLREGYYYLSLINTLVSQFELFFEERGSECPRFKKEYLSESPGTRRKYILNTEKVNKDLFSELRVLADALKIYLLVFVEKPLLEMKKQGGIKTNCVFDDFDQVISFNYTNTYKVLYRDRTIHHIHGKLDENIVLGVNPDEKDELPALDVDQIMFKKYYQRVYYRTDNSFIGMIDYIKRKKAAGQSSHDLVVCGHSLDATDQDIIKDVFEISDSIYIVCHKLDAIGKYVSNLVQIYGKSGFDEIRSKKQLKFVTYEELEKEDLVSDAAELYEDYKNCYMR